MLEYSFMLAYLPVGCLQGHCQVVQIHSPATVTSLLSRIFYFTFRHIAFIIRPSINYINF